MSGSPGLSVVAKDRHRGAEVSRGHVSRLADEGPNDGPGQQDGALMRTRPQNIQRELALEPGGEG